MNENQLNERTGRHVWQIGRRRSSILAHAAAQGTETANKFEVVFCISSSNVMSCLTRLITNHITENNYSDEMHRKNYFVVSNPKTVFMISFGQQYFFQPVNSSGI